MKNSYVKYLGYTEGTSLLVLLLIAMPLKYVWHLPEATRAVGSVHGLLFVLYVFTLATTYRDLGLTKKQLGLGVVLSCLPFGPFIFHRRTEGLVNHEQ